MASLFSRLRNRYAGRPDSEHEQALIRLALTVVFSAYLLFLGHESPQLINPDPRVTWACGFYFAFSANGDGPR